VKEVSTFYDGYSERRSLQAEKTAQVRSDPDKQEPRMLTLPDMARVPLRIRLVRRVRKHREAG
jgi:hypothetical protein